MVDGHVIRPRLPGVLQIGMLQIGVRRGSLSTAAWGEGYVHAHLHDSAFLRGVERGREGQGGAGFRIGFLSALVPASLPELAIYSPLHPSQLLPLERSLQPAGTCSQRHYETCMEKTNGTPLPRAPPTLPYAAAISRKTALHPPKTALAAR